MLNKYEQPQFIKFVFYADNHHTTFHLNSNFPFYNKNSF